MEVVELLGSGDLSTCSKINRKLKNEVKIFWQFLSVGSANRMLYLLPLESISYKQIIPKKIFSTRNDVCYDLMLNDVIIKSQRNEFPEYLSWFYALSRLFFSYCIDIVRFQKEKWTEMVKKSDLRIGSDRGTGNYTCRIPK